MVANLSTFQISYAERQFPAGACPSEAFPGMFHQWLPQSLDPESLLNYPT